MTDGKVPPIASNEQGSVLCQHWRVTGPGQIVGTAKAVPWECPWCEVERLTNERTQFANRLADCEISLGTFDPGAVSEYWLKYAPGALHTAKPSAPETQRPSKERYGSLHIPSVDDAHNYSPECWHITDNGKGIAVCYDEACAKELIATLNSRADETSAGLSQEVQDIAADASKT